MNKPVIVLTKKEGTISGKLTKIASAKRTRPHYTRYARGPIYGPGSFYETVKNGTEVVAVWCATIGGKEIVIDDIVKATVDGKHI